MMGEPAMEDVWQHAASFLEDVFASTGLDLKVAIRRRATGTILDIEGSDSELLQSQTGELLEALQHLLNQIFGRQLQSGERIVCDVEGFRATREAELEAMANLAAKRVRDTGVSFTFQPMNANERRIIHLALANDDDLYTESIGEGSERKLKVALKTPGR
jgi:spoIIIJ-associated protein